MVNQWVRGLAIVAVTGLVLAGCSSKGSKAEPASGGATYDGQSAASGSTGSGAQSYGFDADGNPFMPGTDQPLARVFYFDYDQSQLQQTDLTALEMHADILRNNPERAIVVEGHADERGSREYNLALGERRANAIRSFLTAAGVSSTQIESVSYGEERPEDPGHSEASWSRNRRAVLVYR